MSFLYEERLADTPYAYTIAYIQELTDGVSLFPADGHWHLYIMQRDGKTSLRVGGPMTQAITLPHVAGSEGVGIRFKLGAFMPHLPIKSLLDREIVLPEAGSKAFWLQGAAWEYPNLENAETFIARLVRQGVLVREPLVQAVMRGELRDDLSLRSVQRRFLHATGVTHSYFYQIERARRAARLLQQGVSILDTVDEAGYADQPHLTRSLKRLLGQTPAQILREPPPQVQLLTTL
jgi:hypothetical protein